MTQEWNQANELLLGTYNYLHKCPFMDEANFKTQRWKSPQRGRYNERHVGKVAITV